MPVINGSDLKMFIAGQKVAMSTDWSLDMKMNTRGTSNKDTGKFNTKAVGRMDISASCGALYVETNLTSVLTAYMNRTPVALTFGGVTGETLTDGVYVGGSLDSSKLSFSGNFIISSMTINAADEQNASYTVSFENADATFNFSTATNYLSVYIVKTDCSANAAADGVAFAVPQGGIPGYTFLWDEHSTTQTLESLAPGTYTVTVSDSDSPANTAEASITITEPEA